MPSMESLKQAVLSFNTPRSATHALVENIAQQLKDALAVMRLQGDGGHQLDELLAGLQAESAGLAEAVVRNTPADDRSPSDPMAWEDTSKSMSPTTVGGTVVTADLAHVANEGEAAFRAPDGTVARYPQTDDGLKVGEQSI